MKPNKIYQGNNVEVMKTFPDNHFHSIVTDPPYGINFMGKKWDYDVPSVEMWQEALRVLKPGGHLLSFGGTRTYHRMVCNIEDAGFEIMPMCGWLYGQGFPKALDINKKINACVCGGNAVPYNHEKSKHNLRSMQTADLSPPFSDEDKQREILQHGLPEQGSQINRQERAEPKITKREQSSMEWRELHRTGQGVQDDTEPGTSESETKRVCPGTYNGNGEKIRPGAGSDRRSSSQRQRQAKQRSEKSKTIRYALRPLDGESLSRCSECKRPILPPGYKTALKTAMEPICMARKPIEKGLTIAGNCLKWGTGGLNIDGCRIETEDGLNGGAYSKGEYDTTGKTYELGLKRQEGGYVQPQGRFPANLILDDSECVKALFPETSTHARTKGEYPMNNLVYGKFKNNSDAIYPSNSGSAARFFYCAKPSKAEKGSFNRHPTVKPLALMRYLLRLVTPPHGITLDPYCGSGTSCCAAIEEGFNFVAIEKDPGYCKIANQRILNAEPSLF